MGKSISSLNKGRYVQRVMILFALTWTLVLALQYGWHFREVCNNTLATARVQASDFFDMDVVYRRWAAERGGVYVPTTIKTPPNPYLASYKNRDVTTTSGLKLTLVDPAYMTRQVHELGREQYGRQGHITSLNPLNPKNAPDAWEAQALQAFESGESERDTLTDIEGAEYMRLIRPLTTEASCLQCHASLGYKEGDIRGGISVAIPMAPLQSIMRGHAVRTSINYLFIWLIGIGGIGLGAVYISRRSRESEQTQQALLKSEALLSNTGKMARVGGWELDAKTLEVSWTEETYRIHEIPLGHKPPLEEAINFYHPEDRPKLEAAIQKALTLGEPYDLEIRFITATGKNLWTHSICIPIVKDGKTVKLTGAFQDITTRKLAEIELDRINRELEVKTRQAQEASEFKTKLLSMISHDLKTPLHNILGYTTLLGEQEDVNTEDKDKLFKIVKNVKNLSVLVDNLLNHAQLEMSKMMLYPESLEVGRSIAGAIEEVGAIAQGRGIRFIFDAKHVTGKVFADRIKLHQVLVNLLGNAIKFTEQGEVRITTDIDEKYLRITIEDTGIGMTEEDIEIAFQGFQKGAEGGTQSGVGLGLFIAKELTQLMNGTIDLASQKGKGTKVTLRLPRV